MDFRKCWIGLFFLCNVIFALDQTEVPLEVLSIIMCCNMAPFIAVIYHKNKFIFYLIEFVFYLILFIMVLPQGRVFICVFLILWILAWMMVVMDHINRELSRFLLPRNERFVQDIGEAKEYRRTDFTKDKLRSRNNSEQIYPIYALIKACGSY